MLRTRMSTAPSQESPRVGVSAAPVDAKCSSIIACALLTAIESVASAQPSGLYSAVLRERASPRTREVPFGSMRAHIELGARRTAEQRSLYSVSNDNARYSLQVTVPGRAWYLALVIDRTVLVQPTSPVGRRTTAFFTVDRAQADAAVAMLGATRMDRSPAGTQVEATFATPRARYGVGEPIRISVALRNPRNAPLVQRQAGGRQRGVRDNRFHFRVWRDEALLDERPGPDFGGPIGFASMQSDTTTTDGADVSRWADVARPGRYRVECSYETSFAPDGAAPFTEGQQHRLWDRRFTGAVEFVVVAP